MPVIRFRDPSDERRWVCACDRAKMLVGAVATQQCFRLGSTFGGLLPSDLDGATPPPAGAPNSFVALGRTSTTLDTVEARRSSGTVPTSVVPGSPGTVARSASGLPRAVAATLSPTSVPAGSSSTLTVTAGFAPLGTYSLTVTGTAGSVVRSTTLTLTVKSRR